MPAQFARYRARPVVIEAVQLTRDNVREIKELLGKHNYTEKPWDPVNIYIHNEHGDVVAEPGDWVIKGSRGEFSPCKDVTFREKYEAETGVAPKARP